MKVEGENRQYTREVNAQYNDIKRRYDQTNDEIKRIEQEMQDKMTERTIALGEMTEAKRKGDIVAERDAQNRINAIDKRLQVLDKMKKVSTERLATIKGALDRKMDEKNGNAPSQDFEEVNDQYFEEVNSQYLDIKRRLNQAKSALSKIEQEVDDKMSDRTILEGQKAAAKRNGDKTAEKDAQSKIVALDKAIKKLNVNAKNQKASIAVIQTELDRMIDEKIRNIPGMREHLNEIIRKQSARKLPGIDEKLQPLLDEKAKVEQIILLTSTHPTIENNLKGFMSATKQIEALTAEVEALRDGKDDKGAPKFKDEKRAARILNNELPVLRKKLKDNKSALLTYFKKNEIGIEEADIDALVNGKVVMDKKGNVDLKTTFNAKMGSLNRQIKGIEKNREKLTRTNQNVQGIRQEPTPAPAPQPQPESQPEPQPSNDYNYEEKPRWWQFIKRFRMWNERRQQKRLEEEYEDIYGALNEDEPDIEETPVEEAPEVEPTIEPAVAREHAEFRSSLKYEVLRDAVEREMKEQLKKAKEQGRNNQEGR